MNVERINQIINSKPNLSTALGMEFISTPEDDTCMARMKVDERNRQPFGFLSGEHLLLWQRMWLVWALLLSVLIVPVSV